MKKKICLLLVILAQCLIQVKAQKDYRPGYIVSNENDTLRGFIKLQSNSINAESCNFIQAKGMTPEIFAPRDIRAYRIENSKYYVSKDIKLADTKQKVFLEYLVDGIVDLYYLRDSKSEYYFVAKDTILTVLSNEGKIVTVKENGIQGEYEENYYKESNQYKRALLYLFHDAPDVTKKITSTAFDYRPLINITKEYHNSVCKDKSCIDYTRQTRKGLYLEPYAGLINTWVGLKTSNNHVHEMNPYVGIQLRLKPFKGFSMWNLLTGVSFSSNNSTGDFENYLNELHRTFRIYTKYTIMRIPITVEYTIPTHIIQPYFSASFNNILLLNKEAKVDRIYFSSVSLQDSKFRGYQFGLSLGVGVRCNVNPTSYFFLKNEFESRMPAVGMGYILDFQRCKSWMINFGYGFKIR